MQERVYDDMIRINNIEEAIDVLPDVITKTELLQHAENEQVLTVAVEENGEKVFYWSDCSSIYFGSTDSRPNPHHLGQCYFDTELNKPIWSNGSYWVDSTGTEV